MSALGQKRTFAVQNGMSALTPKADMCGALGDVRFVPEADMVGALIGGIRQVAGIGVITRLIYGVSPLRDRRVQ